MTYVNLNACEFRAGGVDVLLVEQNAETALVNSDYANVIEVGAIATEGPASELASDDEVRRAYMGR